jgi:hypothetical protein
MVDFKNCDKWVDVVSIVGRGISLHCCGESEHEGAHLAFMEGQIMGAIVKEIKVRVEWYDPQRTAVVTR